jgi:phosphopantetheine adenylyltransferase
VLAAEETSLAKMAYRSGLIIALERLILFDKNMNDEVKLAPVLRLQAEMLRDETFETLCRKYRLPWDFESGYVPRWYNGPAPDDVRVLFLMAEPAAISSTERRR